MGCIQSLETTNQTLRDQVVQIEAQILQTKQNYKALQEQIGEPDGTLRELQETNNALKQQNTELHQLQAQRTEAETAYTIAMTLHQKLQNELHDSLQSRKNMLTSRSLDDKIWRPLTELVQKFVEFDVSGSGFVDRNEFFQLCTAIESDLKIVRLFSEQNQHSSSSVQGGDNNKYGMINSLHETWSASTNDKNQWYQIDAVRNIWIAGVVIQGKSNAEQWIRQFRISYSVDGANWNEIDELFVGNQDRDSHRRVLFPDPIHCRYIRLRPVSWNGHISMRMDLLWIENYNDKERVIRSSRKSEFTFDQQDRIFDMFDLKKTGGIDITEFIAVLDREAIRNPELHPYRIIKQTMNHLLFGNVNIKTEYNLEMLASWTAGYKYEPKENVICCVCYYEPGIYGYSDKCDHCVCGECLKGSLVYILDNGKFPAYCIGCKAEESMTKESAVDLDMVIKGHLLRFWIEEKLIDLELAVRFYNQQNRSLMQFRAEEFKMCKTIKKCPDCRHIIYRNEMDILKCNECGLTVSTQAT